MKKGIMTKGFNALLVTQFLGAANDNLLKQLIALQVVAGVWAHRLGEGGQGIITVFFTLPFLLFSGWAGQLADRYSKQRLSQWVKILEVFLGVGVICALWFQSLWLAIAMLIMLGFQSTIFGPAKYGMIPELFPEELLSKANGVLNMLTNISIIIGAFIGGCLSDFYPEQRLLPGIIVLVIALLGYGASRLLEKLPAQDPSVILSKNPFQPYTSSLKVMAKLDHLIAIMLGWSFFNFIGILVLMSILDFKVILKISDTQTSLLNLYLVVGIAIGSLLAALISKDKIRIGLVPIGAAGITLFLLLLGFLNLSHIFVIICLVFLGNFGGLYMVPLQAFIQAESPLELRGRILGTTNFMSFVFISIGGGIYWLMRSKFHMSVQPMLLIYAGLMLLEALYLVWRLKDIKK